MKKKPTFSYKSSIEPRLSTGKANSHVLRDQFVKENLCVKTQLSKKNHKTKSHAEILTKSHHSSEQYKQQARNAKSNKLVTLNSLESEFSTDQICVESQLFIFSSKAVTQKGYIPDISKVNQDTYLIKSFVHKDEMYNIFGVFDGHGVHGHLVSKLAKELLEVEIIRLIKKNHIMDSNRIYGSFQKIQREILNSKVDVNLSGTTVLIIVIVKDILIEINLGDSQYGLFSYQDDGCKFVYGNQLHNFTNTKELDRVKNFKCVIKSLIG